MATDIFMVVTDQRGALLAGESQQIVYDPYLRRAVPTPVEVLALDNQTENTFVIDSGAITAGKVVFDPLTITKYIDALTQTTFLAQAQGAIWKFVDIMLVKAGEQGGSTRTPYLSYRLGSVGVSQIGLHASNGDDLVSETLAFTYGTLQIGYQAQKQDGSYLPFVPTGWDRIKNVKI